MVSPTTQAKAPLFAVIIHEKGGAERREVFDTSEISVGRVQGNDLMLPKGNVSKRHARLVYRDGRFIVTDLNSTNGTYVNRRRITQATIVREGDRIYIGDFVLRVEAGAAASDDPNGSPSPPAALAPAPVAELPPGALLRSATEDDDELTGSMPRIVAAHRASVPGSEASMAPPRGDASVSSRARSTQNDEEDTQRALALDLVAELVLRVTQGVPAEQLEAQGGEEAVARFDPLIREAWARLSGERHQLPQGTGEAVLAMARAELSDLGPLSDLLTDPTVTEIAVIGPRRLTVSRGGRQSLAPAGFSGEQALRWAVARLCALSGEPMRPDETDVERRLADGMQLSAALRPGRESLVLLRRPRRLSGSLDDLVRRGTISRAIATFLQQCLAARLNLLVVGPRDGGIELVVGALASAVPDEEILCAGDFELGPEHQGRRIPLGATPDQASRAISLAARVPLGRLLVEVGSAPLTGSVCAAIADGADGVIACRTAGSLRRGLSRIISDIASTRSLSAARELVAGSFEVAIEVARLRDDRHRVLRIAEVTGTSGDELALSDVFTFIPDRTAVGGLIEGSFVPCGATPPVAEMLRARGAIFDSALFSRPPSR
ncbi:MAG TPA: FHA domain-containing protein [Polyangiaceae bacterium]|nr:FHA domain-containing protein [Polyangiaceae bacterium]